MLPNLQSFFEQTEPMRPADAPGGGTYLTRDPALLDDCRTTFAQYCAGCHASKQPPHGTPGKAEPPCASASPAGRRPTPSIAAPPPMIRIAR